MIKYQKTSPVGVDYFINVCQELQQSELPDLLEVSEATMHFYGRTEVINEVFNVYVSGNKYIPVGMDSKLNFISYFVLDGDAENIDAITHQKLSFYCHGNLNNIFSSISTHRADQEFRLAMENFIIKLIEYTHYDGLEIIKEELQPFHSLKLNFTKTY